MGQAKIAKMACELKRSVVRSRQQRGFQRKEINEAIISKANMDQDCLK